MALTTQEQNNLRTLIAREGGLAAFTAELTQAYADGKQANALSALNSAISVTVSNWPALATYVGAADNAALYQIVGAINTAAAARDTSNLGALMVALYAATKAHFSL